MHTQLDMIGHYLRDLSDHQVTAVVILLDRDEDTKSLNSSRSVNRLKNATISIHALWTMGNMI